MKRPFDEADREEPKKKSKLVANLQDLLDVSDLQGASDDELEARFQYIAKVILCDYELIVGSSSGESRYSVLELEFYLWLPGSHEDPFTHGSEGQRIPAQWHFHRSPRPSKDSRRSLTSLSYRGGSRKGLDLTIASSSPQKDIRGGILLRTLSRTSPDPKIICGPSLIVDEILHASGAVRSISSLVETKWDPSTGLKAFRTGESLSKSTHLTLLPREVEQPRGSHPTVYRSPRIGLDLSHPGTTPTRDHPRLQYLPKPYRFFIYPDQLDKGRPQTFLGVLHSYLPSPPLRPGPGPLRADPAVRAQVMTTMAIKRGTFDKYFDDYATGVDKGAIRTYVGTAGKGAASSPATYLRMIGTLERFFASS
ncbi:hypothetical protein F5887DRAFT_1253632 [Amanita rubescens]|nr:hypothetical protein F5887DRAFT_1253632 [Amanita rubescens]